MNGFKLAPLLLCICVSTALADTGNVTLYADGAIVEQSLTASKGIITMPLPATMIEGSLRVTPGVGATIRAVDIVAANQGDRQDKELDNLSEQRLRLLDRLQALEVREEIFKSAAKSQSGKAPRKSKANPDPMQSIRTGTDFAITQLETVYTSRRKTEQEIKRLEARIAGARKSSGTGTALLRIDLDRPRGVAVIRFATSKPGWIPSYRLDLDGDTSARIRQSATPAIVYKQLTTKISADTMANGGKVQKGVTAASGTTDLANCLLGITGLAIRDGIRFGFSGRFVNNGGTYLPPGEMSVFRGNSYLGKLAFSGLSSGRSRVLAMGMP